MSKASTAIPQSTKYPAMVALASMLGNRAVPEGHDWLIAFGPVVPGENPEPQCDEDHRIVAFTESGPVRIYHWAEPGAVFDLMAGMWAFYRHAVPEYLLDQATVKFAINGKECDCSLRTLFDCLEYLELDRLRPIADKSGVRLNRLEQLGAQIEQAMLQAAH